MKLLNTLLTVLLMTLLPSLGWSTPLYELVKRDGLYYPKFSDVPFTGKVTGETQGYVKDGRREGAWVDYWVNGQLWNEGTYKNGKREGVWVEYWDNGQLWSKGNYKNGKKEGDWVGYHDHGQLKDEGNYKNGKVEGAYVRYHYNGQLYAKGNFKNGKEEGLWVVYDEEGTPIVSAQGIFKKGVKISD